MPQWNVGDQVWMRIKNISTTGPSINLDHRVLCPEIICQQVSISTDKLTLPLSMKGVHLMFQISVLKRPQTALNHRETTANTWAFWSQWQGNCTTSPIVGDKTTTLNTLSAGQDLEPMTNHGNQEPTLRILLHLYMILTSDFQMPPQDTGVQGEEIERAKFFFHWVCLKLPQEMMQIFQEGAWVSKEV